MQTFDCMDPWQDKRKGESFAEGMLCETKVLGCKELTNVP